jgi:hypothetical protein
MGKAKTPVAKRAKAATREAYDKAESTVMAAVGRSTVKRKMKRVKAVAARAGTSALIAGSLAAAGVVVSEIRKRRKPA